MHHRMLASAPLLVATLILPGCLVSSNNSSKMTGAYIGPSTFAQVEAGITKTDWVLAAMGEPTTRSKLDDGSEIWRWSYTRRTTSSGGVFLIAGGSTDNETVGATCLHVRDGVVVKAWRD
ncbi:MAG: hypothetical protein JNM07_02315 [Phycisphaerae bacterium]|nr:hypothetical protein [Phycisphaerae bacterium]